MKILFSASLALLLGSQLFAPAQAYNATPDYWQCDNRVNGTWTFGHAPYGCDARRFGDDNFVYTNLGPAVFNDNLSASGERARYMSDLYPILREVADYYIWLRKPNVDSAEFQAWRRAVFAIAHQESYWSHYRKATDNRLKLMRGDYGHGHGIMQVDDRWHYVAVTGGKGWKLTDNIIYSLEEYYRAWQNAPTSGCLSSASNWRNRARAAYSAYNGGPSKICRWTNPNDTWARNDIGYAAKYDNQDWLGYVADTTAAPKVDVSCLIQGGSLCAGLAAEYPGRYRLVAQHSGKAVDVEFGGTANGVNIWQWSVNNVNGGAAQLWEIESVDGGFHRLRNVNSGKYLGAENGGTSNGTNVRQWEWTNNCGQKWRIDHLADGTVRLANQCSSRVLDIAGGPAATQDGANAQIWEVVGDNANQRFRLEAEPAQYRLIARHSGKAVDVEFGGTANGVNIWQWSVNNVNGGGAQLWELSHVNNGYFRLRNVNSGKYLGVENGGTANASNIRQWEWTNNCGQFWRIVNTGDGHHRLVNRCSGKVMDVDGGVGARQDGANIHLWEWLGNDNQKWRLVRD